MGKDIKCKPFRSGDLEALCKVLAENPAAIAGVRFCFPLPFSIVKLMCGLIYQSFCRLTAPIYDMERDEQPSDLLIEIGQGTFPRLRVIST